MKKIIALLFLISVPGWGAYIPGPATDSTTFTLGTTPEMPMGGVYWQNPVAIVTSTTTAAIRMTPFRFPYSILSDANGVIIGISTANAIQNSTVTMTTV